MRRRRTRIGDDGTVLCTMCGWRVRTDAAGRCPLGHRVGVVTSAAPETAPTSVPEPAARELVGAGVGDRAARPLPAWQVNEAAAVVSDLAEAASPLPTPAGPDPAAQAAPPAPALPTASEPVAAAAPDALDGLDALDALAGLVAPEAEGAPDVADTPAVADTPDAADTPAVADTPDAAGTPDADTEALRTAAVLAGVDTSDPLVAFVLAGAPSALDVGSLPTAPAAAHPAAANLAAPRPAAPHTAVPLPDHDADETDEARRWRLFLAAAVGVIAGAAVVIGSVVVAPL